MVQPYAQFGPRPRGGTLASFVLWHLERGRESDEIVDLARQRVRGFRLGKTLDMISFWESSGRAAVRMSRRLINDRISSIIPPRVSPECKNVRVFFTAHVSTPDSSGAMVGREVSFSFDTSRTGTVGDLYQEAIDITTIWRSKYYNLRSGRAVSKQPKIDLTYVHCI